MKTATRIAARGAGAMPPRPGLIPTLALCIASLLPLRAVDIETAAPSVPPAQNLSPASASPTKSPAGLTLEDCYQEALLNNAKIRGARADFENALGAKIILQSTALPTLTAQELDGGQKQFGNAHPRIIAILNANFYQTLFDASIPPSFRQGRALVATAQQNFFVTASTELDALRTAFFQALAARENVAVQESIRTRLKANLTLMQQSAAVGRVGKQAVDTAALRLAEIEPALSSARGDYRAARIEMAVRMGREIDADGDSPASANLDSGLPLPQGVLEPVTFRIDFQAETDYALTHRPDLAALRLLVAQTKNNADIAGAPRLPKIGFGAHLTFIPRSIMKKDTGHLPMTTLSETVSASWLILDGGSVRGALTTYDATREGYQIALRQMESDVPRDLRKIADSLRTVAAMVESSTLAVSLAEENYRITEAQIATGNATQLDLLNAQSNLLDAQYTRINALLENNLAVAQFDTVTGRYLDFIPANDPAGSPSPAPAAKKPKAAASAP